MSKTIITSVSAAVSGDGQTGLSVIAPSFPFTNNGGSYGGEQPIALSSGNNTVAIPSGHRGVWIIPPNGSTIAKVLKGVAGDTGITIDPVLGAVLFFPAGAANFVINAAAIETVLVLWL